MAHLEFERLVPVVPGCVLIGSRLDADIHTSMCRLAFHGNMEWQARDKVDFTKNELTETEDLVEQVY